MSERTESWQTSYSTSLWCRWGSMWNFTRMYIRGKLSHLGWILVLLISECKFRSVIGIHASYHTRFVFWVLKKYYFLILLYLLSYKKSPRILKRVACPFSSRFSHPQNWIRVSYIEVNSLRNDLSGKPTMESSWLLMLPKFQVFDNVNFLYTNSYSFSDEFPS